MSSPRPFEEQLLGSALQSLKHLSTKFKKGSFDVRLQILEAAASRLGGFRLDQYRNIFGIDQTIREEQLLDAAKFVIDEVGKTPIPPALALSVLAREQLGESEQRSRGSYNTDFRLALHLADLARPVLQPGSQVIDPACGAGSLLVAVTLAVCGPDRKRTAEWLKNSIVAADLSDNSLRAARLSLSALTDDLDALRSMYERWRCQDSLLANVDGWRNVAPSGFDLVVGNPPWEKVKLSRHEFLRSTGAARHYGSEYQFLDDELFGRRRASICAYAKKLSEMYPSASSGEPDLYMAFLDLFVQLTRPGGCIAALVPAGLIRSQGTETLRRTLLKSSSHISVAVLENRARFFSIDTRFKFLALCCVKAESGKLSKYKPIRLIHEQGTYNGIEQIGIANLGRDSLSDVRPDLTLPEVRSNKEWQLFLSMARNGLSWDDSTDRWRPEIVREVDMTAERKYFKSKSDPMLLPVVEGRMVQQHRFGAKGYISGSGRRAVWEQRPIGDSCLAPQFWINKKVLLKKVEERTQQVRAGFCDITGQTNERSMMACVIPSGVVCGNKVPTVTFPSDPSEDRLLLWIAIVNSIPFDWLLRRVVTTTVNYFLLLSVKLPRILKDSLLGIQLIECSRELRRLDQAARSNEDFWRIADLRCRIDLNVAAAYGLGFADLRTILADFPLLDRGQRSLPGELKSTITADFILERAAGRFGVYFPEFANRVDLAKSFGAVPYIPTETANGQRRRQLESLNGN